MMKRLLISLFAVVVLAFMPVSVHASAYYLAGVMEMQAEQENIELYYNNGTLQVTGAEGCTLEVVAVTGKRVLSVEIDTPAKKIELNIPKGCYIVRVGKVVRKVSVR